MNHKAEAVFKLWLTLTENEKRDFIKELFYFNNLPDDQKKAVEKKNLVK